MMRVSFMELHRFEARVLISRCLRPDAGWISSIRYRSARAAGVRTLNLLGCEFNFNDVEEVADATNINRVIFLEEKQVVDNGLCLHWLLSAFYFFCLFSGLCMVSRRRTRVAS